MKRSPGKASKRAAAGLGDAAPDKLEGVNAMWDAAQLAVNATSSSVEGWQRCAGPMPVNELVARGVIRADDHYLYRKRRYSVTTSGGTLVNGGQPGRCAWGAGGRPALTRDQRCPRCLRQHQIESMRELAESRQAFSARAALMERERENQPKGGGGT